MSDFLSERESSNRFVELQKRVIQPLAVYLKLRRLGKCTVISFIDSTPSVIIQDLLPGLKIA